MALRRYGITENIKMVKEMLRDIWQSCSYLFGLQRRPKEESTIESLDKGRNYIDGRSIEHNSKESRDSIMGNGTRNNMRKK